MIFGKEPQHCAMVASHDFRKWVRLVGKNYNLRYWTSLTAPEAKQAKMEDNLINLPKPIPQPPANPNQPLSWVCFTCGFKNPLANSGYVRCV